MKDLTIEVKDWKVHQDYQEKRAKRAEEERKKEMEEAKKMRSERIRARVREKSRRAKEMEENMQREVKTSSSTTVSVTRESEDDTLIQLIEQLKSCVEVAESRTLNWQRFCMSDDTVLTFLLAVSYMVDNGKV